MREFHSASALADWLGQEIAVSEWLTVEQTAIDQFAAATGDHQWIHVDPPRARRESPFGAPVAHGFLTASLIPTMLQQSIHIVQRMGLNYGLNKVRFPAPVPAGSRVRGRFVVQAVEHLDDGTQVTWLVTVQRESADKPVCVAELITRHYD
jgi:acyl dehydratase